MSDILKLLEYNFWANDLFITRLKEQKQIPEDISKQLSHLLLAHRTWLNRMANRGTLDSVWNEIDWQSWEGINIELYNETSDLVKSGALDRVISYQNSKAQYFENFLGDILHHLIIHSGHHRAQIALLMRQNKILPPQSDYIFYLRA